MKKPILMTRARRRVKDFLKNRSGQSTTEYILILAIVVMIASKLKNTLGTTMQTTTDGLNTKIGEFMSP